MKKTNSKILILFTVITVMLMSIISTGCGNEKNSTSTKQENSTSSTRKIVDGTGKTVTIPYEVTRIAASGALNQIVLILGGADKLVVTAQVVQTGFFPKVYPRITEIPPAYTGSGPGTLNMETLLKANPQVVFGTFTQTEQERLQKANIAFLGLKLETPEDIKNTITMVGKVLGESGEEKAKKFNEYYDNNIKYVSEKTKSSEKVKVFVASGTPKGSLTTNGPNDINTSYIEAAGGINIAAENISKESSTSNEGTSVDFEFLYKNQPDVIIATSKNTYDYIMDTSSSNQWQSLTAVKNKQVYLNPKGVYLWSVRSAEGALQPLWLAKNLHPDLFNDLDIKQKVKEFYKNYYYYDLSDNNLEDILNPKK